MNDLRVRGLAALALICALFTGCATPSGEVSPRMGIVASPTTYTRMGTGGRYVFLSAHDATGSADSRELDALGYRDGWFQVDLDGFASGTDLAAHFEFRGGNDPDIDTHQPLPIDGTLTIPKEAAFPTGLTVDSGDDGFDIADTFETDTVLLIPMLNIPPYVSFRYTRTSGGTGATIGAKGAIQ